MLHLFLVIIITISYLFQYGLYRGEIMTDDENIENVDEELVMMPIRAASRIDIVTDKEEEREIMQMINQKRKEKQMKK